jgi:hypothetical protein
VIAAGATHEETLGENAIRRAVPRRAAVILSRLLEQNSTQIWAERSLNLGE